MTLLALGACSCKKKASPLDGENATPTATPRASLSDINGSTILLPCGAIIPCSINGSEVYLPCPTPVDLSGILSVNGSAFHTCVAPSALPPTPGFSTFSVEPTICSSVAVTCSGPVSCYGQPNGMDLTLDCGDPLPCTANACAISILCPTLTDLSYLLSANGVTFYMHQPPCKLPFSMNASAIVLF